MCVPRYKGKTVKRWKKAEESHCGMFFSTLDNNKRVSTLEIPIGTKWWDLPCVEVGPHNWSLGASESETGPLKVVLFRAGGFFYDQ